MISTVMSYGTCRLNMNWPSNSVYLCIINWEGLYAKDRKMAYDEKQSHNTIKNVEVESILCKLAEALTRCDSGHCVQLYNC